MTVLSGTAVPLWEISLDTSRPRNHARRDSSGVDTYLSLGPQLFAHSKVACPLDPWVSALRTMPGSQGFCKNSACINPKTGKRRTIQSGCQGYCFTCARTLAPAAADDACAKKYVKYPKCMRCQTALAQITDPDIGARYCKACKWEPDSCHYCQ